MIIPNSFQQCQWNYVLSTAQTNSSVSEFDLVNHEIISPVDHINSWFQESTWRAIARKSRVGGRPSIEDSVILRLEVTKIRESPTYEKSISKGDQLMYGTRTSTIEPFSYKDLIESGGFGVQSVKYRNWVYGKRFGTRRAAKAQLTKLCKERDFRVAKRRKKEDQ
jgi:hypothetical protein